MDIRSILKNKERKAYRKMSRGMKLKLAIELSELVLKLRGKLKAHGKRIQGDSKGFKRI